jgi:hypothetical protein
MSQDCAARISSTSRARLSRCCQRKAQSRDSGFSSQAKDCLERVPRGFDLCRRLHGRHPIGFKVFGTRYRFLDILMAAIAGAVLSFVPTVGPAASLVATVAVLYWRLRQDLFPDIVISVFVARLAMVPVLLLLVPK